MIELLVVIAIFAVLAALLFPAFARAKDTAKGSVCLSNSRQMGLAATLYMNDNDDFFPLDSHSGSGSSWFETLTQYSRTKLLWRCPSDPSVNFEQPLQGSQSKRLTSYGTNYYATPEIPGEPSTTRGFNTLTKVVNPAGTGYIAELSVNNIQEHFHPGYWYRNNDQGLTLDPKKELIRLIHVGRSNFVFMDGHAKSLVFESLFSGDGRVDRFDPRRE